jgi:4a-hydroxytetrahydrobiopterin dehydratase
MDQALPSGWMQEKNALTRTFARADFVEALGFVLGVARLAETANHHPDIDLRYNKVRLSLTTHDAGHKVTAKDFALAEKINGLMEDDIRLMTRELHAQLGV